MQVQVICRKQCAKILYLSPAHENTAGNQNPGTKSVAQLLLHAFIGVSLRKPQTVKNIIPNTLHSSAWSPWKTDGLNSYSSWLWRAVQTFLFLFTGLLCNLWIWNNFTLNYLAKIFIDDASQNITLTNLLWVL